MASEDLTGLANELNDFFTSVGSITAQKANDLSLHHGLNVNLDVPLLLLYIYPPTLAPNYLCSTKSQKIR